MKLPGTDETFFVPKRMAHTPFATTVVPMLVAPSTILITGGAGGDHIRAERCVDLNERRRTGLARGSLRPAQRSLVRPEAHACQ